MNKRPGHVNVTVDTGYCNFCGRPRNLRREEHQLGTLVRTIITCETCHRTLSSSIGVAVAEPEPDTKTAPAEAPVEAEAKPAKPVARARRAPAKAATPAKARTPVKRATTKKTTKKTK